MAPRLDLRPVARSEARAFVLEHHRHHSWPTGFLWLHGLHDDDGSIVGIAVCGRPVARPLDDGLTMEVTRLCTDGEPNANSMLYAAAERTCRAKGYRRWLTYVLVSEWDRFDDEGRRTGGAGLRAAGWRELWRVAGRSWDCAARPRTDKHPTEDKVAVGGGGVASQGCPAMTRGYLSDREVQQVRLVDIAAELVRESAVAWLINDGAVETWVPKSQAEHNRDGTFTMPEWLAAERGLV